MYKIWLIIKREYLTRVTNKTFIISTILLPLFFVGFIAASTYFSIQSKEYYKFAVNDNNGIFKKNFHKDKFIEFDFKNEVNQSNFQEKGYDGLLNIPTNYDNINELKQQFRNELKNRPNINFLEEFKPFIFFLLNPIRTFRSAARKAHDCQYYYSYVNHRQNL